MFFVETTLKWWPRGLLIGWSAHQLAPCGSFLIVGIGRKGWLPGHHVTRPLPSQRGFFAGTGFRSFCRLKRHSKQWSGRDSCSSYSGSPVCFMPLPQSILISESALRVFNWCWEDVVHADTWRIAEFLELWGCPQTPDSYTEQSIHRVCRTPTEERTKQNGTYCFSARLCKST